MSLKAEVMSLQRKHVSDRAICLFVLSVTSTWVMGDYFDVLFLVWDEADIDAIIPSGAQFTHLSGIKLILLPFYEMLDLLFFRKHRRNVCNLFERYGDSVFCHFLFFILLLYRYYVLLFWIQSLVLALFFL